MKHLSIQINPVLHTDLKEAKKEFESRNGKIQMADFISGLLVKGLKTQRKEWSEIDQKVEEIKNQFN